MIIMEIPSWTDYKATIITSKKLRIQYSELSDRYELYTPEDGIVWHVTILKDSGSDHLDFENNYKADANLPSREIHPVYTFIDLKRPSNGARNMNVNGSLATPIIFEFAPLAGDEFHLERLMFGIDDVGLTDMGLFGGISALTNGLLLSVKTRGQTFNIGTITDNVDIALLFPGHPLGQSGVLDTSDGYYGSLEFKDHIHLVGDKGDYIRFAVRDNLTGVNILRAMAVVRKVL